jgi:hypothetical protein
VVFGKRGGAAVAEPGAGRLSGGHADRLGLTVGGRIAAVLGRSVRVAVVGAEEALHPLLLRAPDGRASCALSVGELGGVNAAPNRLAVDVVLGGEVGDPLAVANPAADFLDLFGREFGFGWHGMSLLRGRFLETLSRDSSRDRSWGASSGPRDITPETA